MFGRKTSDISILITKYLIRRGEILNGQDALHRLLCHWSAATDWSAALSYQHEWDREHYHTQYELDHKITRWWSELDLRNSLYMDGVGSVLKGIDCYEENPTPVTIEPDDTDDELRSRVKKITVAEMYAFLQAAGSLWTHYLVSSYMDELKAQALEYSIPIDPTNTIYWIVSHLTESGGFRTEADIKYWKNIDLRVIYG